MNTFTEQIEKSKRFGEDEEYCCARVGCKNKIERERNFGESDSKYLSKYCSSEWRKKAIFYSEDKENIDTSWNKYAILEIVLKFLSKIWLLKIDELKFIKLLININYLYTCKVFSNI